MKKFICYFILSCIFSFNSFAQTVNDNVTVEINNIVINGGTVYLAIFSTAQSFRREEPDYLFVLEAVNTTIAQRLTLPNGEYVITAFQDANNNKTLDFGLFGIPRELVGISNFNGRGFPTRDFNRQKILIDRTTDRIVITLYRF